MQTSTRRKIIYLRSQKMQRKDGSIHQFSCFEDASFNPEPLRCPSASSIDSPLGAIEKGAMIRAVEARSVA